MKQSLPGEVGGTGNQTANGLEGISEDERNIRKLDCSDSTNLLKSLSHTPTIDKFYGI